MHPNQLPSLANLKLATQHAASAASVVFSKWVGMAVRIEMDRIEHVPFHEVIPHCEPLAPVSFGLYLPLEGEIDGALLFLLSEQTGFRLLDSLMRRAPGTTTAIDDMGRSALQETANIVGSAYINALVSALDLKEVKPSPPRFLHDISQSILESVVLTHAHSQDKALLIDLKFTSQEKGLEWKFFFLPTAR